MATKLYDLHSVAFTPGDLSPFLGTGVTDTTIWREPRAWAAGGVGTEGSEGLVVSSQVFAL